MAGEQAMKQSGFARFRPGAVAQFRPLSGIFFAMSIDELFAEVHDSFPTISAVADRHHVREFGAESPVNAYSWFESLANALNLEMSHGIDPKSHRGLLERLERALNSSEEVFKCLDVAFVENLFWQMPATKAAPFWEQLPARFKSLYQGFHHRTPVQ